jgi:hypothetical protein
MVTNICGLCLFCVLVFSMLHAILIPLFQVAFTKLDCLDTHKRYLQPHKQVLRQRRKCKQSHATLYYITLLHVSIHHLGHHHVAAHLERGMFTNTKTRRIFLYNKNNIITVCRVCVDSWQ